VRASVGKNDTTLLADFSQGFVLENYDSCNTPLVPPGLGALAGTASLNEILRDEPVPNTRYPEVPRIRVENGPFFGPVATMQGGYTLVENGVSGRLGVGLRLGLGLAALINDPLNAQAFVEPGLVAEHSYGGNDGASMIGYALRLRAPGYFTFVDGLIGVGLAEVMRSDCASCVRFAAASASGGFLRLWRERHIGRAWSMQVSALRDVTAVWYRHEPSAGRFRVELYAPLLTARHFLPISGIRYAQSSDTYLDIGPSLSWSSDHRPYLGFFASASFAARVFP
jgi:hypothetical protein